MINNVGPALTCSDPSGQRASRIFCARGRYAALTARLVPGPRQFASSEAAVAAVEELLAAHSPWPGLEDAPGPGAADGDGGAAADGGGPLHHAGGEGGGVDGEGLATRLRSEYRALLTAAVEASRRHLARSAALSGLGGLAAGLRKVAPPSS